MPAPLMAIKSTPSLPREADVVVIGGGVVGVFAAYYLARRGGGVALLEKGRVASEKPSRNWGWCRQQNRDARELPMTKSVDLWEKAAYETGEDTGFRRCGLFYLSQDESELADWLKWSDFARRRACALIPEFRRVTISLARDIGLLTLSQAAGRSSIRVRTGQSV